MGRAEICTRRLHGLWAVMLGITLHLEGRVGLSSRPRGARELARLSLGCHRGALGVASIEEIWRHSSDSAEGNTRPDRRLRGRTTPNDWERETPESSPPGGGRQRLAKINYINCQPNSRIFGPISGKRN